MKAGVLAKRAHRLILKYSLLKVPFPPQTPQSGKSLLSFKIIRTKKDYIHFSDKFYAAVPVNHRLARMDSVSILDCFQFTQLLPPISTPLFTKDNAIDFREIIELPYRALISFVAQGQGISYLPS
jgi:hypothetical protein